MSEFKDKVVTVTGASSGIGGATAVEYAKHGAKLVLGGRNEEKLNKTGEQCQQQGLDKDKILLVNGDLTVEDDCNSLVALRSLTVEDDCNSLVDMSMEYFGQIDILVNNAAGMCTGTFEECTIADVDFMFNTTVRNFFMVSKRAVPHLIKSKGSIVHMSGISGLIPLKGTTALAMVKAAVVSLTQTMAQELAVHGVNVNSIAPAVIKTDIFKGPGGPFVDAPEKIGEFFEQMAKLHPLQRVGTPEEVAKSILYLTSEAASFVTGTVLPIDGGMCGAGTGAELLKN